MLVASREGITSMQGQRVEFSRRHADHTVWNSFMVTQPLIFIARDEDAFCVQDHTGQIYAGTATFTPEGVLAQLPFAPVEPHLSGDMRVLDYWAGKLLLVDSAAERLYRFDPTQARNDQYTYIALPAAGINWSFRRLYTAVQTETQTVKKPWSGLLYGYDAHNIYYGVHGWLGKLQKRVWYRTVPRDPQAEYSLVVRNAFDVRLQSVKSTWPIREVITMATPSGYYATAPKPAEFAMDPLPILDSEIARIFNPDGTQRMRVPNFVVAAFAVAEGITEDVVYVLTDDGRIYACDPRTGNGKHINTGFPIGMF